MISGITGSERVEGQAGLFEISERSVQLAQIPQSDSVHDEKSGKKAALLPVLWGQNDKRAHDMVAVFDVAQALGIPARFAQLIGGIAISDGQALLEVSVFRISESNFLGNFQPLREVFNRFFSIA
jgi:hypothetical protein